ncbi:MAG TPA: zinc ribbon domain-containing protein, partial [Xenococcaceae cyanobacterium]
MIVCSNCNHQNPEGSIQCENCYTPLPLTTPCPNCGAIVQTDATFCGQCGFNLQAHHINNQDEVLTNPFTFLEDDREDLPLENNIPTAVGDSPMVSPWDEETTEDITFGQAMPVNDTEIMNASSSSFIAETPWESKASESEEMPWEMVNSTSNSEILELSDVDMSDSEISEAIPELPDIDQIEEMPDLSDLESSELEMREEMPDLSDFESSELEMREEMPELPDFESSELEMREEMPELPDLESSELEMGEEMPELPDLDASELEMSGAVPELPDLEPSEAIDFGITTVEADASSATQLQ